jgi:hypothetical protein
MALVEQRAGFTRLAVQINGASSLESQHQGGKPGPRDLGEMMRQHAFLLLTHLVAGCVATIGFRARSNASVAVDDRKRHGILSALEVQRIIGAVNINDLARTQASPNLLHSTVVVAVTRHDVDIAVAIDCPVEGDDVFIANRRHNGLIRPNRA